LNKKNILSVVILVLLVVFGFVILTSESNGEMGVIDTILSLEVINGEMLTKSDIRERPTLIVGWTIWCSTCRQQLVYLKNNYDEINEEVNVIAMNYTGIERTTLEEIRWFINALEPPYIVAADNEGKAYQFFQSRYVPASFLINTEGEIVKKVEGPITVPIIKFWLDELETK
jgi:thiol-disulfide isomerase/thioredoxin